MPTRKLRYVAISIALVVACLVIVALRQPVASRIEFVSEADLALTQQQAWQRLSDLGVAHNYVPGIVKTEISSSRRDGPGASRRVYSSPTKYINETITRWDEGNGYTLRLHDEHGRAPMPFKDASFSYRLLSTHKDTTTVQLVLSVAIRGGILGESLVNMLMASTIQARIDLIAKRLKDFYESEDPRSDRQPELSQ